MAGVIDALRTSCRNVRTIVLSADEDGCLMQEVEAERKMLLISHGAQLYRTNLQDIPIATCDDVLLECPYVRCRYNISQATSLDELDRLSLLAARIDGVNFYSGDIGWLNSTDQRVQFKAALSKLTNLRYFHARHSNWNSEAVRNCVFADPQTMLQELSICLPVIDDDIMLLLAPSLYELQMLSVRVNDMKRDDLPCLFKACPNIRMARFSVDNCISINFALDCTAKLVNVAWAKDNLKRLHINFEAFDNEYAKDQFMKELGPIVQNMRLRRRNVFVSGSKLF